MTETTQVVEPGETVAIALTVNGAPVRAQVPSRLLLSDFLRHQLAMTGTHVGCEHGVCGACTVHIDGRPARSCLTLAAQLDGCEVTTVEGLCGSDGALHPVQRAFKECHALQCGFCTPGFMMSVAGLLDDEPDIGHGTDDEIREAISGNVCRCTGYMNIVSAVRRAGELTNGEE